MNKLFISFEFNRPDRTYDRVVHAISTLGGPWIEVHYGHWYVSCSMTPRQVCDRLKSVVDPTDKLIVIDATNDKVAWLNLGADAAARLQAQGLEPG